MVRLLVLIESVIIIFLFFTAFNHNYAQTTDKNWKTFASAYDYKSAVLQGNTVWIATSGGAVEWNADTRKINIYSNTEGLSNNFCTAVAFYPPQTIIVAHKDGMIDFLNLNTKQWTTVTALSGNSINELTVTEDRLLISMNQGFAVMNLLTKTVISYTPKFNNLPLNTQVLSAMADSEYIWCMTPGALARILRSSSNYQAPSEWRIYDSFSPASLSAMTAFKNQIYLYSTAGGVYKYDRTGDVFAPFNNGLSGSSFRFSQTGDELYCAGADNIFRLNGSVWENLNLTLTDSSGQNFQNKFFIMMPSGKKAILDYTGTIYLHQNNQWLPDRPNTPGGNYFADLYVKNNKLWCASLRTYGFEGSGFYRYDIATETWTNYNSGNITGMITNNFQSIRLDDSGYVWLGSWAYGVTRVDLVNRRADVFSAVNGLSSYKDFCNTDIVTVNAIGYDPRGYIWMALHGPCDLNRQLCVYSLSAKTFCYYSSNILGTQNPGPFLIDGNGNLWITTYPVDNYSSIGKGVLKLIPPVDICQSENATVQSLTTADGLLTNTTTALAFDRDGVLWIGMNSGLQSFSGYVSEKYEYPNGPIGEYVQDIKVDRFNNKWIATQNGVSLLTAGGSWAHFTSENSKLVNNNVKSVACSEDGKYIFFGTYDHGMSRLLNPAAGNLASSSVSVYPNPFILGEHDAVTFTSIPDKAVLRIISINGELIRSIYSAGVGLSLKWDGKNSKGQYVSSGVYFFNIHPATDATEKFNIKTGKFVVIKK